MQFCFQLTDIPLTLTIDTYAILINCSDTLSDCIKEIYLIHQSFTGYASSNIFRSLAILKNVFLEKWFSQKPTIQNGLNKTFQSPKANLWTKSKLWIFFPNIFTLILSFMWGNSVDFQKSSEANHIPCGRQFQSTNYENVPNSFWQSD